MNRNKGTENNFRRSRFSRVIAVALAFTLTMTSSGFTALAEELNSSDAVIEVETELQSETVVQTEATEAVQEESEAPAAETEAEPEAAEGAEESEPEADAEIPAETGEETEEEPEETEDLTEEPDEAATEEASEAEEEAEEAEESGDEAAEESDEEETEEADDEEEAETETEEWDGCFTNDHPEWGGIIEEKVYGVLPFTIKITVPEDAFTEPVDVSAIAVLYTPETAGEKMLNTVLEAAGKDPEENDIYDLYVLDISFTYEDGEEAEAESAVKIEIDTSEEPVDIGAGEAEAELDAAVYRYKEEIDEETGIETDTAVKVADNNKVTMDENNMVTAMKFSTDKFSQFVLLVTSEAEEDYEIMTLAADDDTGNNGQVIDGYGEISVTDQQSGDEYTITIKDAPTNMPISLGYEGIEITDKNGDPVGAELTGRLYYVPTGSENDTDKWIAVSYFKLNGSNQNVTKDEDGNEIISYEVVAYSEDDEAFDLTAGSLYLKNTSIINARVEIMPIQTNTLCALEDNSYTQTMIGAIEMSSNPQTYYYPGYEDDYVVMDALTNNKGYTFYYGTLGSTDEYDYKKVDSLKEFEYAQIVKKEQTADNDDGTTTTIYEYYLYPLDETGAVVKDFDGSIYVEYDQVYSFDVEYENIVNEHTEDNGDVYLWMGTQYYVDKYHNQGTTSSNYTNATPASGMGEDDLGVWVQLGKIREGTINGGTADFSDYKDVTRDQLEKEGVTSAIVDKVIADYNYGIAGPYTVAEDDTKVEKYTARVTGHIGDEFVASDVFGTEIVYMVTDTSQLHETDWVNLGAHASDGGTRAWWYWINDYYQLNNYEDELEFLEIAERIDSTTGEIQVRLEADEMGASGLGEEYDVWNTDLITKRESVVQTDLMTNPDKYIADGVKFSGIAGLPHHVQLRMNGTFETVDQETGETYFGKLSVLADADDQGNLGEKAPYIEYSIPAIYSDGTSAGTVRGSSYISMENDQEATSLAFTDESGTNVYVPMESMFDTSQVVIFVRINFTGTITSSSGVEYEYTEEIPYTYEGTLTEAQLREAYDTCPNNAGYDFAVNLSEAVQNQINTDTGIILYKVWDDNTNAYNSRGNVDGVVVTLERSKNGTEWETVLNDMDEPDSGAKEFTIEPPLLEEGSEERDLNANQWSLVLTSDDLDLTYVDGDDEGYYEFRIASEEFEDGKETNPDFTYNTIINGTSVTNTLLDDTISITGEKLWEDAEGAPLEDIPVNYVILTLYQDGHYFDRQTVTADDESKWEFSFTNLPKWNGTKEYVYTLGEMMEDGTSVEDGQSVLLNNKWFHIEITENTDEEGNPDGTYTFKNVENPPVEKDVDADGDGEYGDTGVGVQVGDTVTYKIDYVNYYPTESTVIITDVVDEGLDFVEASDDGVYDKETRTITWTLENVEAKYEGIVTFKATVNETALVRNEIDNTAEVQVADDPAVETNTVYNPVPDKDVDADGDGVYEDSGMYVAVGSTVVYKIDYENPDDEAATVTITDKVDIGLDFVSATDNGTYNESDRQITWVIEDVEPHTNGSVYFTATVNEDAMILGYVENTAVVQVGNHAEQKTKTVNNPIIPVPDKDVDVEKRGTDYGDNGVSVQVGDTVIYKITYENYYDQVAKVVITDAVDEGLDFVEASDGGVYDEETRTVTWTFESVEANYKGSVTFSGIVNETALIRNEIDNTAEVQVEDDPSVETNTVYNPVPDKDVDADGDEVYEDSGMLTTVGGTLVYKIDYENPDDEAATVTITDELDIGLDYVSSNPEASYNETNRTLTWVIGNVEPHTNGSVYFTATVNENATEAGYVKNTAIVQVGNHAEQETKTVYNPVTGKDVDADGDGTYGDNGESVQVGDILTYEITYFNGYEDPATVTITDMLDEGLTYVSSDPEAEYDESTNTLTWVIEDVESQTGGSVTFTATVNENALEINVVDNTATVQVGDDPDTSVETNTTHNPVPDKDVDADGDGKYEDSGMTVKVGDTLVYKIDYENPDDDPATVTITDELDIGLDYVSSYPEASYNETNRTLTWTITGVEPHTNGSVYFTATVNENALVKMEVDNTAVVQVGSHEEQQTRTVYNPLEPSKDEDADGDGEYGDSGEDVKVGDTITYIVYYVNDTEEVAEVTITDVLDDGLDYVDGSASGGGTYDETSRTITWIFEDVDAYTGGSVTFKATVNSSALAEDEIKNTAAVQVGTKEAVKTNTVDNPVPDKGVDADGDGKYGDSGLGVAVGTTVTYIVDYFNGYDDEKDITITDTLDVGLDYVEGSASDDGIYDEDSRTITWTIPAVEGQTGGSVTFQSVVNDNALVKYEIENTAYVVVGNDSAVETNTVYNPIPDKDVDADGDGEYGDSGLQVNIGDTLTYRIDYQNSDDTAATVTITDELDIGLDFAEASDGGTYDEETRTITWVIENVAPHSEEGYYVTFEAVVNDDALIKNEVDNTATVQVGDHPAQDTRTVYNPVPDKDVDADEDGEYGDDGLGVKVGDTITYEINYFNGYEDDAKVTITDTLDEGLDYVENSASDGGIYDAATRTVTWVIDAEALTGGSVTFKAVVNEDALVRYEVENTASVEIEVGDNSETSIETNTVYNPVPDKDVDADGDGEYGDSGLQVNVGDTLTYKIDYENPDDEAATVTITDVLDEGLDFEGADNGGTYDEATRTITWIIEGVGAHTYGSVVFTATVNEDALIRNEVDNTATVQTGDHPAQDTRTVYNPVPDKDVDADGDSEYGDDGLGVNVGDTITYEINYFNGYEDEATVTITDALDEGLDYVEGSASDGGIYDAASRTVTWVINAEALTGGSVTFEAVVNEDALVRYEIENTAYIEIEAGDNPATSIETNTVYNPVPDKDVDADGDGEYGDSGKVVEVGDILTYRISYQNPDDEAATVTITDELDDGLDFIEASDGGTYDSVSRTITWVIEDVAPHSEEGYCVTFTAEVNESALIRSVVNNTATVQVGDHPEQQTRTVWNPLTPGKTVDVDGDGSYGDDGVGTKVGDTLTYIINYVNDTGEKATVTIIDILDTGLDYVLGSADPDATFDMDRTLTWVIEDVEPNEGGSVVFQATVNEKALVINEVENTATVQIGDNPDTSYETNTVYNPVPDKDVDADGDGEYGDSSLEVKVGDTLTYRIDYENADEEAADITITDKLDTGLDFVSADNGGTYDSDSRTITWVIEAVPAHTNGSVTFTATVNENALVRSVVDNTATVQVGNHSAQDTGTVWNPLTPGKDVDADGDGSYGDSGEDVHVGDTLTYVVNYFNTTDHAEEIYITDTLDEGLDYVEGSAGDYATYDAENRTIIWDIEDVESHTGGCVTFDAVVNDKALHENEIVNQATVEIRTLSLIWETNIVDNPVPDKDVDADGDGEYGDSGLGVQVGDTLTYMIEYFNGYDEEKDITITDTLDSGLDYIFGSADPDAIYDNSTLTWIIGAVPAQSGGTVTFQVTVNDNALLKNEVENTAYVQVGDDPAINTNTVYNPVPDKDVDADGDGEYGDSGLQVNIGDTLTYRIDYQNSDDAAATVTITDELDIGLDFAEASDGGTYDEATRTITWVISDVAPHSEEGYFVTFKAVVNDDAVIKNEVDNTATVQVGDHPAQDTKTVYNPVPDKDVDADGDGEYGDDGLGVKVGDTITYEINYFNGYEDAATVTITDILDEGLDYVEGSASDGGTYDAASRTVTWVINAEALTGGSVTFDAVISEAALIRHEVDNSAVVEIQAGDNPSTTVETDTIYNPVPDKDVDADGDGEYGDSGLQVNVGDSLTYRIDYENPYDEAAEITVTDTLDKGLDYVIGSADPDALYDMTGTLTWIIEVGPHTSGSVYFTAAVNENALVKNYVENTAYVQVGDDDVQQTRTVYNPVPGKDVDADSDSGYGDDGLGTKVGDVLTYEISYFNGYEDEAIVTITDALDEGLDYVEGSASDGGSYDAASRTVTWVINAEALTGGSVTFEAVVNEDALIRYEVENTAYVEIQAGDNPATSIETNTVYNPVPDKDVDIHNDGTYGDSGLQVNAGDSLTYKIDYENPDDEAATVTITDVLDEGLDFEGADNGGTYDEATRTITWIIEGVGAHTYGSVVFTATVNEDALIRNEVDNTATVQTGDHPAQDTNTVWNPLNPIKDVDADGDGVYGDDGYGVSLGDELTYSVFYFNEYDKPAAVTITDILDEGLDYVAGSAGENASYDSESRTITWIIPDVGARTGGFVTFEATVNEAAFIKNEVDNTATVQIGDHQAYDTNTIENPVPEKDVDVDITDKKDYGDNKETVGVGQTLTYKVTYRNTYDESADVIITDALDPNVEFAKLTGDNADYGSYDETSHTITWLIPDVAAGESGDVEFQVIVLDGALVPLEVENTAVVKVGNGPAVDTNTVENPVEPAEEPVKSVDADGDGDYDDDGSEVGVGDEITYKITYKNHHGVAETVTIVDTLDPNVEYVSASDKGSYDAASHTVTWTIKNVSAFEEGYVTVNVKVLDSAVEPGEVFNSAAVQIGNDEAVNTNQVENPVEEPEPEEPSTEPETPGTGTSTGGKGGEDEPVQTSDDTPFVPMATLWAMALMLIIISACYMFRRRYMNR